MAKIKELTAAVSSAVASNRVLRLGEVLDATKKSRATLYRDMAAGRFPRQVSIGLRAVGWRERDVVAFLENLKTVGA